jgi:hypothetical protein
MKTQAKIKGDCMCDKEHAQRCWSPNLTGENAPKTDASIGFPKIRTEGRLHRIKEEAACSLHIVC